MFWWSAQYSLIMKSQRAAATYENDMVIDSWPGERVKHRGDISCFRKATDEHK